MDHNDDTLRQGKQAKEDTYMAMLETGMMPGSVWCGSKPPEDITPDSLLVHRVTREQAEGGGTSGALMTLWLMRHLPDAAEGRLLLSFDGWADDPRELAQIPCVIEFCQGMLLGFAEKPNLEWAQNILGMLMDERDLGLLGPDGEVLNRGAADVPGALWLVAHAHPVVFTVAPSGRMLRDLNLNVALHAVLLGE